MDGHVLWFELSLKPACWVSLIWKYFCENKTNAHTSPCPIFQTSFQGYHKKYAGGPQDPTALLQFWAMSLVTGCLVVCKKCWDFTEDPSFKSFGNQRRSSLMFDKTKNLIHLYRCHDRCWSLGRVEYLTDFQISWVSWKKSLKLPTGKRKPGCEAGVVAMTTKAEEMWMKAGIRKQSCAGLWRKGQILGKKGGAGCW